MANLKKYTRTQIGHILKHCERAKNENGEYIKFGNQNITECLTWQNYNQAPKHTNDYEFIKNRTEELKCLKRQDVNVACSRVVTIPQEFYTKAENTDPFAFVDKNPYITKFFGEKYANK